MHSLPKLGTLTAVASPLEVRGIPISLVYSIDYLYYNICWIFSHVFTTQYKDMQEKEGKREKETRADSSSNTPPLDTSILKTAKCRQI